MTTQGKTRLIIPSGFEFVRAGGHFDAIVRSDHIAWYESGALGDPEERLRTGRTSPSEGRGAIARVPGGPSGTLILKKYRRGGMLAPVLPDLFLSRKRMTDDLAAGARTRAREVPCAAAVGLVFGRSAGPLRAVYLLTEEIPGAVGLDRALRMAGDARASFAGDTRGEGTDRAGTLSAATRIAEQSKQAAAGNAGSASEGAIRLARAAVLLVRRLHDAGIVHRDLNLRNLLVRGGEMFIIDLDGASISTDPTPAQRFSNLSRLDRSYIKTFGQAGPLSHEARRALLDHYCGSDAAMLRLFEARLGAHKRVLRLHALLWRAPQPQ